MKEVKPRQETRQMWACSSQRVGLSVRRRETSFLPVGRFRCLLTGLILQVYQSIGVFVFTVYAITVNLCLRDRKMDIKLNWEITRKHEQQKQWKHDRSIWDCGMYSAKLNSSFMLSTLISTSTSTVFLLDQLLHHRKSMWSKRSFDL